jgi:hypothetical protein
VKLCKCLAPLFLLVLIATIKEVSIVSSFSPLVINVRTNQTVYHYRQLVTVFGNLTLDDNLVASGLVAIQVLNPSNTTKLLRTVPANITPSNNWMVEITSFAAVDAGGNPMTVYNRNGWAYFETQIRNNNPFLDKDVLLAITLCDSDATYFHFHWMITTINSGATHEELVGIWIEDWVSFGNATAYASIYNDWPKDGGYPYAPEKNVTFGIVTTDSSPIPQPSIGYTSYKASFRLPPEAKLGTYTIKVSAYSGGIQGSYNIGLFYRQYELLGDIIYNRKIDIFDVVKASIAYGSQGGEPEWDPEADLDPNGSINIFDVVTVTSQYGTTY